MYRVVFVEEVENDDLKKIDSADLNKIFKAISKKLRYFPEKYGKFLRYDLKSLLALKVGKYRVVYRIKDDLLEVLVISIGKRKDDQVYLEAVGRLTDNSIME